MLNKQPDIPSFLKLEMHSLSMNEKCATFLPKISGIW